MLPDPIAPRVTELPTEAEMPLHSQSMPQPSSGSSRAEGAAFEAFFAALTELNELSRQTADVWVRLVQRHPTGRSTTRGGPNDTTAVYWPAGGNFRSRRRCTEFAAR